MTTEMTTETPDRTGIYDAVEATVAMVLYRLMPDRGPEWRQAQADGIADMVAEDQTVTGIGEAAAIGVAAGFRLAENFTAQDAGRADALGLDSRDRATSWAGRYDGAV